jgi:Antitoxin Xre/MbcA/ParS C-terminal toxin-binding domain
MAAEVLERVKTALDDERLDPAAIRGMVAIGKAWDLTGAQSAALIRTSERSWIRIKGDPAPGDLDTDQRTRASALLGLYKGLHDFFGPELADKWVKMPNRGPVFGGQAPLDLMLGGGIPAMLDTRDYVDALGNGM